MFGESVQQNFDSIPERESELLVLPINELGDPNISELLISTP